jgi:FtsP/CotA-like multicopper oxidase with cupredoxin domain
MRVDFHTDRSYLLNNLDEGTHPFHFHGHRFWIMAEGDGVYDASVPLAKTPAYRDTLAVQNYGYALIRFVADNPGVWICKRLLF